MSGIEYVRLDQITSKIGSGATPRGGKESYKGDGISLIRSMNVYDFVFSYDDLARIDDNQAAQLRNVEVKQRDILLNITGASVCRCCMVPKDVLPARVNQHVSIIRLKPNEADARFVLYTINSGAFKDALFNISTTGATREALTKDDICRFKIPLPKLPAQRKIAAILSAYDELIENNRRRIALLEKLAEEIYHEWFARLRFPGHELTRFVKGLPTDWEIKRVKEVVIRKGFGRIYREAELFDEGRVVVIDQSRADCLGFYDGEPQHVASPDSPIILFGDHTCKMVFMTKPFSLAENVVPFKPKPEVSPYFLFHLVKGLASTTEYKRHWTDLTNREVLIPRNDLQTRFENSVRQSHEQIELLRQATRRTQRIRNLLLPRLISGKLPVENIDIQFPPGMAEELNAAPAAPPHA
ncbi:MAG: type restriction enzyme subunit [Verrucomicrobiota bacterium]|jgi:type I restriction enzyme S subunit